MNNCSIIVFILCTSIYVSRSDILVKTSKGTVRGRALVTPGNKTFHAFTGIPYAKPPVGKLRFQAPQEAESWSGIRDATRDPNFCYQVNTNSPHESEDCLYINVFTTVLNENDKRKLPVVVGIYGGAFRSGAAGYGNGGPDWFIERDIVMVSFNYRVGPMGFLSTDDTVIPGNAGLKDQQLAIQWTYNNIERFGGNKSHINIQGQSAGGASVTYQLFNKKNAGLFQAALIESGSALCSWAWTKSNLEYTIKLANTINNNVSLSDTSSKSLLQYLQKATAKQVDDASAVLYSWRIPLPTLEPDHAGAFITKPMYELLDSADLLRVPLFIGINSEEDISIARNIPAVKNSAAHYDQYPSSMLPPQLKISSKENQTKAASIIKKAYVGNSTFSKNLGAAVSIFSDNTFTRGIIRFAELYSRYRSVYFYQFSYKGPMGVSTYSIEGADNVVHGEQTYYLNVVRSGSYDNTKYENFPASDVLTHKRLVELWSNFYKYRNPTPKPSELLSNIIWPAAKPNKFLYLNINRTLEIKDTPKSPRYNAWRKVYDTFGKRPFVIY